MAVVTLPETHRRLGRHVDHDERSWDFPAEQASELRTVVHQRLCAPYDQGNLGSCTGNAMAGLLMTVPVHSASIGILGERDAVNLYEWATAHDGVAGQYPPDDTGSSGLAVAKAAKAKGWIHSYAHAFGLQHALGALVLRPVIIGIPWFDSFDSPGPHGLLSISKGAQVRGGHEVELLGIDVSVQQVRGVNSWGVSWADRGCFSMSWATLDALLHDQGDVVTVS